MLGDTALLLPLAAERQSEATKWRSGCRQKMCDAEIP